MGAPRKAKKAIVAPRRRAFPTRRRDIPRCANGGFGNGRGGCGSGDFAHRQRIACRNRNQLPKESVMKSLSIVARSLLLSLLFAGSAFAADQVNINTADAATLDEVLVNVGPSKAKAIVDYREANGAFRSAEQLAMVKGIG